MSDQKLVKLRRMGCMEQLFTALNPYKISWGCIVSVSKINGLENVSKNKIQNIWNKLHYKYDALQTQFLTVNNVHEFDIIYNGTLPFNVIDYGKNSDNDKSLHDVVVREMNSRFILLNDLGLNDNKLLSNEYNIKDIPPLYRVFRYHDHLIVSLNHAIADGLSSAMLCVDFMCLLNDDYKLYRDVKVPYKYIENSINKKYESSKILNYIQEYLTPTSLGIWFGKIYSHNKFCVKYNPISFYLHNDEILRFKYMYGRTLKTDLLTFPLNNYDKWDWKIDYTLTSIDRTTSLKILNICKQKRVAISALTQYIFNAAVIEAHNDVLTKDYYKTVVGNIFSTIPMYNKPRKPHFGMHCAEYLTYIEYYKNIDLSSNKFWSIIGDISKSLVTDERVTKLYKNKFPWINTKKFMKDMWENNDFYGKVCAPPTISNPGPLKLNINPNWKYKITHIQGGHNPGVGWGSMYIVGSGMVKGIDEMVFNFIYGTQFLDHKKAKKIINIAKNKFISITKCNQLKGKL